MNARILDNAAKIMLIIGIVTLISTQVSAQEVDAALTAEEIVARHEATWAKLEKLAVKANIKSRVHGTMTSMREGGRQVESEYLHDEVRECLVFCNGPHESVVSKQIHEKFPDMPSERIWRIDGLVTHQSYKTYSISKELQSSSPISSRFGRKLEHTLSQPTTLRNWVSKMHPKVSSVKNEKGEACWKLVGDFKTRYQVGDSQPVEKTEKAEVIVNAERGFMMERADFVAPLDAPFPSLTWQVAEWQILADGNPFPKTIHIDCVVAKAKNFPADDGTRRTEFSISEVLVNPPGLEAQFEIKIPEDSIVYDTTGRAGVSPIAIWGKDGKSAHTFKTNEEFAEFTSLERGKGASKYLQEVTSELFPGCKVEVEYQEKTKTHHIVVRDVDGSAVREFQSEDELRVCAYVQFHLAYLLGKEISTR